MPARKRRLLGRAPASRLLLVLALTFAIVAPALAQQGHDTKSRIVIEDLPVEQRQRARRLWDEVVCACPRENWSKTLTNCPDGCSDPQKQEVLAGVAAGLSDEAILDRQEQVHGPRVRSSPQDMWTYLLPFLVVAACAGLMVVVMRHWSRSTSVAGAERASDATDDELRAVERELEELT